MIKKIFFIIIIFLVSGELLMRLDERFQFLSATHIVKIKTSVEETPEFDMVKKNALNVNGNSFRVMVLGDSYIHGGGINFKDAFSQQLKGMLQKANSRFTDIYMLDISKPSSNSFDNVQAYFEFAEKFKPNVVILGYNYNDVEGNLDQQIAANTNTVDSFSNGKVSSNENRSFIKKIYDVVYNAKVIKYVMHNIHDELKARGHIIPNSVFDITLKAYSQNKPSWQKSQVLLQQMIDDCKKRNSLFIALKYTEINLLEYPSIFNQADSSIHSFFAASPAVDYMNVGDAFKGEKSKDYILSKYDGHPNEKAHIKIAQFVFDEIKKQTAAEGDFNK
jgi:hypothetical protein